MIFWFCLQSLDFYADLEVLDLSHNSIDALGKRHFESQIMLTSLNLSYNSLHYLEEQAFSGLTQLQVLDLRHNHLTRIDDYVLGDLEELTDLDLSFNSIEYLSSECFTSLYRLRSLNLNSNRLQMVILNSNQIERIRMIFQKRSKAFFRDKDRKKKIR